jgi:putative heme-binding domain-containing protein
VTLLNVLPLPNRTGSSFLVMCYAAFLAVQCLAAGVLPAFGQQGEIATIWSPLNQPGDSPSGTCYFRKKFTIVKPEQGELLVDSRDQLTVFLNSRQINLSSGDVQPNGVAKVDVSRWLRPGVNVIAVALAGSGQEGTGLALRLRVKETGEVKWRVLVTDESWLTRTEELPAWQNSSYEDVTWLKARATGQAVRDWGTGSANDNTIRGTVKGLPVSAADAVQAGKDVAKDKSAAAPGESTKSVPIRQAGSQSTRRQPAQPTDSGKSASLSLSDDQAPPAPTASPDSKRTVPPVTTRPDRQLAAPLPPAGNPATANPGLANPPLPTAQQNRQQSPQRSTAGNRPAAPQPDSAPESQYQLAAGFQLQQLMPAEETGSVIGMAFNEFGQLLFSREGGGVYLADLSIPYGQPRTLLLCEQVTNCQGLLPLNGRIYVTGQGPEGLALYELARKGSEPKFVVQNTVLKFSGEVSEHGPHSLQLGPDGMIYVVIGNHSGLETPSSPKSPYRNSYDADLIPRYEDPGGHAAGVKAPGGTIVRVTLDGKRVETFAGGLRNVYDLAFNAEGELFVHESDMEADVGLAWYRPNSLFHVTAGADLGWRSGWAQMPEKYPDTIAPIAQTGRGSPTGIVSYQHLQFPSKYHNCLFLADWSEGRILSAHLSPSGSSYSASTEVLLQGKPLNVTDLDVGEDGGLYFSTGGRGTRGGIFRILWTGPSPLEQVQFKDNLQKAVQHPQPNAAWARQNLALLRQSLGNAWNQQLTRLALDSTQPDRERCRALEMLYLYSGPLPKEQLSGLLGDTSALVRAKAAWLCGLCPDYPDKLTAALNDESVRVRRAACESLVRHASPLDAEKIWPLFSSDDRTLQLAARRLLEQLPDQEWCKFALASDDLPIFVHGSLATLNAHPSLENSYQVLAKVSERLQGFLRDPDFFNLLRVTQLALVRGQVDPGKVPGFTEQMLEEFPTASGELNAQLAPILAYLGPGPGAERFRSYLADSGDPTEVKIVVAMNLAAKSSQLDDETRLALIDFLEKTQAASSSGTYKLYLIRCVREAAESLTREAQPRVIENGLAWPNALVKVFYKLPEKVDSATLEKLIQLDGQLGSSTDPAARQARLGIIAILAQSGNETAMEHLRALWRVEDDRRADIAVGLAQDPNGKNWNYLVASLPILDDRACQQVILKLQSVSLRPMEPKYYRQVLELGYRLQDEGGKLAADLLHHWSTETVSTAGDDWRTTLDAWKIWYEAKWPLEPPVNAATAAAGMGPAFDRIMERLNSNTPGDPERGLLIFQQANCAKCHRVGLQGQSSGPDLTGLGKRFSKRETLESIVDPNRVISDRYRSLLIQTVDGQQLLGMKVDESPIELSLLLSDGKVAKVRKDEIEDSKLVAKSTMPGDLLNNLTLDQIADLFAYLHQDSSTAQAGTTPDQR